MADERSGAVSRRNYTMDEETIFALERIAEERGRSGAMGQKSCMKSMIVRDAVRMLYEYEVLHCSAVHPADMGPEVKICTRATRRTPPDSTRGTRTS